jgi:Flp pilus assembly protein TadD
MAELYLERYPYDWLIWAYYGDSLRALGAFSLARTALDTARGLVDRDDTTADVLGLMAKLECEVGDYASAERLYRDAAGLQPAEGRYQLFLGITLRRQGRDWEAEACYRHALTLDGDRDEYLLNLGFVLQARGALQEAESCFAEALTIDPNYEEARHSLEDVRRAITFQKEFTGPGSEHAAEQGDANDKARS